MATLVLGAAGTAIGGAIGGTILGVSAATIGGFIGSSIGSVVDSWIVSSLAPTQRIEGARLDTLRLLSSVEGAVIPRLRVDDLDEVMPVDSGDGTATVKLGAADKKVVAALVKRTMTNPSSDPTTGADLGAGPGAGRTKNVDMGGGSDL